uniref:NADH:quinone oxidoreductase/Mrp antiporter membrane subunit domain-containing protein n=1 Tax=Aegilops tauschii subsp. strangulata TaxID=200361 RepID=A0A452XDN4_AEGTS
FLVYLFLIGIYGLITSRNTVKTLICLELILNSNNENLITFSDLFDSCQLRRDIFANFVIALAAAEAAIGIGWIGKSLLIKTKPTGC